MVSAEESQRRSVWLLSLSTLIHQQTGQPCAAMHRRPDVDKERQIYFLLNQGCRCTTKHAIWKLAQQSDVHVWSQSVTVLGSNVDHMKTTWMGMEETSGGPLSSWPRKTTWP